MKHNQRVKTLQLINLWEKERSTFVEKSQYVKNIMMNLKVVMHQQKKEKEPLRQDQGLKSAIINLPEPIFHVQVLQLFLYAQFAID